MVEYLRRSREGGAQHNAGGLFLREMELRSEVGSFAEILSRYIGQSNAPDCFICFIHMTADQR